MGLGGPRSPLGQRRLDRDSSLKYAHTSRIVVESRRTDARFVLISLGSGLFTGVLAGLVGLGGAEARIPFSLYAIMVPLNESIIAIRIISFATSAVSFGLRVQAGIVTLGAI